MAVPTKTPAQTLIETIWGTSFFDSLPPKWKASLKMKRFKTPGVPNGTSPDAITEIDVDNLVDEIVATSQVTTNRTNELEKITEKIQVALLLTTTTEGQDYDEEFDLVIPYTEHLALKGMEIGDARKEIHPLNSILSEVKTSDLTAFDAVLATYKIEFPNVTRVDVPDFLESLQVLTESEVGNGSSHDGLISKDVSGNFNYTLPYRATTQGSATITKEVVPILIPFSGYRRNTKNFIFFLRSPVNTDDVANKLQTLTGLSIVPWVNFQARPLTIIITSRRVSLQVGASATLHRSSSDSGSAFINSAGVSESREVSITTKTIRVPETIHGTLALDIGTTNSAPMNVSAIVQAIDIVGGGIVANKTITDEGASVTVAAFGLVATPGATALPSEGLLLVGISPRIYKYGYVMVNAECIDASTL